MSEVRRCPGCGGVVGQDCWNPQECEWIARDIAARQHIDAREHEERGWHQGGQNERARILALLTDPAVVEEVARAHYGDRWAEECGLWRARRLDDMAAALDVLRARIEEDL